MEIIFCKVSLVDVSQLSQTCKILNDQVGDYLKHRCLAYNIEPATIKKFLEDNEGLLTMLEQTVFQDDYWKTDGHLNRMLTYQALYFHEENQMKFNCKRVSLLDPDVTFVNPDDGDNDNNISIDVCELLERLVLSVNWATWLEFSYTFKDVDPGKYSLGFKFKADDEEYMWPDVDEDSTELAITHPEGEITTKLSNQFWRYGARGRFDGYTVTEDKQFDWRLVSLFCQPWWSVTLSPFSLSTKGDVSFRFKDEKKYKQAFYFDYIQLTKH